MPYKREKSNIRIRKRTYGNYIFLLREVVNDYRRTTFFVLNILETTKPESVDLSHYFFDSQPEINRMIKISGDFSQGSVLIMMDNSITNEFSLPYRSGSSIIIREGQPFGTHYKKNEPEVAVNVESILKLLINYDFNRFFTALPEYKNEQQKKPVR